MHVRLVGLNVIYIALLGLVVSALGGCSTTKDISIITRPGDASVKVDGVDVGRSPVVTEIKFKGKDDRHEVAAMKAGYKDQFISLTRDTASEKLVIEMKPVTKKITFTVVPATGLISVNGRALTPEPVGEFTSEMEFTLDSKNKWTSYEVTAERMGFAPAKQTVTWTDKVSNYVLNLEPLRKDLSITSNPSGATVYLDDQLLGTTPLKDTSRAFPYDVDGGKFVPHVLKVSKPGYPEVSQPINWDEGKVEYSVDLKAKSKVVRFLTDPPGAKVSIDGAEAPEAEGGVPTMTLSFPPINNKGELKTYTAAVSKKASDTEWQPAEVSVGWDEGKTDYQVHLKEIITRPVSLLVAKPERGDNSWAIVPQRMQTIAMKDVTEGQRKEPPVQLVRVPGNEQIDTLTVSPDGATLLFTVLFGKDKSDFRSQIRAIRTDGSGGMQQVSDGKALELQPSFTPDGSQIVFSSNRGSARLSVWTMSASGAPGITNLTTGDTYDLWPSIDSDPKPRLYYVRLIDSRPDARLFMTQLGTTTRTDLTTFSGTQPRVSPKADSVIFVSTNDKTGKRDICRMSDHGGVPENLTNSPDADEFDPAISRDGSRVAYVSDRAVNSEGQHYNSLWVMNLADPSSPTQITLNGSWDDSPAWDANGNYLYFRSNRGGEWGIWKIAVR